MPLLALAITLVVGVACGYLLPADIVGGRAGSSFDVDTLLYGDREAVVSALDTIASANTSLREAINHVGTNYRGRPAVSDQRIAFLVETLHRSTPWRELIRSLALAAFEGGSADVRSASLDVLENIQKGMNDAVRIIERTIEQEEYESIKNRKRSFIGGMS